MLLARAIAVCCLVAIAATAPADADPAPPVTTALPASAISDLAGCWRADRNETWTFRADGDHGLAVVRELADATYADRARIPRSVLFDPAQDNFAFAAAGRIHGLMMVFRVARGTISADVYTSHDGKSYGWTGSSMTLQRCAGRSQ